MRSKVIVLTLILILLADMTLIFSADQSGTTTIAHVYINDTELVPEESEGTFWIDSSNRVQAPLRILVEGLGYQCNWDEETSTITIPDGPLGDVIMTIGRDYIIIGNDIKKLDTVPVMRDGNTYVPLRAISEALDFYVDTTGFGAGSIHILSEYTPEPEEEDIEARTEIPESEAQTYDVILGEYTTWFSSSSESRKENIRVAAGFLHGQVIQPGEEFSFNTAVGPITKQMGYKDATVIKNGKYVTGVGGGVCQVSTTLFNAALTSNMTITRRYQHSLRPAYVPLGMDAAIVYNSADFRFVNPYDEPVMIMITFNKESGYLAISIRGNSTTPPEPALKVTQSNGTYTLTRSVDGVVNYTATSKYSN